MTTQTPTSLPSLLKQASVVYVIDRGNFTDLPIGEHDRIATTAPEQSAMLEELIELMRERYHLVSSGHGEFDRIALVVDDLSGYLDDTTPAYVVPQPRRGKTSLLGKILNVIGAGRRPATAPGRQWPVFSTEQAHLDSIGRLGRGVNIQLIAALLNRPNASQVSGEQRDALMGGFHHAVAKNSRGRFHALSAWPEVA